MVVVVVSTRCFNPTGSPLFHLSSVSASSTLRRFFTTVAVATPPSSPKRDGGSRWDGRKLFARSRLLAKIGSREPYFSKIQKAIGLSGSLVGEIGRSECIVTSNGRLPLHRSSFPVPSRGFLSTVRCFSSASDSAMDVVPSERTNVLVIGGGGREHSLCYTFRRSPSCDWVYCAPGNPGISHGGDATCIPHLNVSDSSAVIAFCREREVGLVVIGPEKHLVCGLADDLGRAGVPVFGPSAEAARLEGSKRFMKNLCCKYGIPTAKYKEFTSPSAAKDYIRERGTPIVVKADGLASGKGVTVATTLEDAYDAVDSMLVRSVFGSAGSLILIEEFLEGEEVSFFALVDGEEAVPLESAQDHKRVGDGDTGPNTGGMGAYSPAPILTKELASMVMETIIFPTAKAMSEEGCRYRGVLYAGLIIEKKTGLPKLIEYNVRFGDPECQAIMVRLETDLATVLLAACRGELGKVSLRWSSGSSMVVVMASRGYPGSYEEGTVIRNLEEAEKKGGDSVKIFHAGTARNSNGEFVSTGGRVLGVTARGSDLGEARENAYRAVHLVDWPSGFCRHDIGWRALKKN